MSNLILFPGLTLLIYFYYRGFRLLKEYPRIGLRPVLAFGVIAAAITVCTTSFYSFDLNAYINYGWQQARYHANPYCLLVAGTEGYGTDPMFTNTWALNPLPYGFVFAHIARIVCMIADDDLQRAIMVFKAANLLAWSMLAVIVYWGAVKFKVARPDLSLYLYLWSPIILMHSLSGCHNDILMTLPAMAGIFCASLTAMPAILLSLPLVAVAAMVKFVWIIAYPFLALYIYRKCGWSRLLLCSFFSAALALGLAWHYKCGPDEIRWVEFQYNLNSNTNSMLAAMQNIGKVVEMEIFHVDAHTGESKSEAFVSIAKVVLSLVFSAFTFQQLAVAWSKRDNYELTDVIKVSVTLILVLNCVVSGKFYPWYTIMFLPAALWLPECSRVRMLCIWLSCSQLFAFTFLGHCHVANFALLTLTPIFVAGWQWKKADKLANM